MMILAFLRKFLKISGPFNNFSFSFHDFLLKWNKSNERGQKMQASQLKAIISRLEAMLEEGSDIEVRRFEKEGEERCMVRYDRESESFLLIEHGVDQTFQFDDIDLAAMEIYDLIQ